jgi:hypothetical protein
VAGIIPGHNITEAGHGNAHGGPPPGETKFDSHDFKETDGFRDTHTEKPNAQNGNKFEFEDHKEDSSREGKDVQVHSSHPNGERVDAKGHYSKESNDGIDVKDVNGANDTVQKNTSGTEFNGMFQKHHAGPDDSDAHDSKVTHSGGMGSQHQKEEHKDPNLHTMHETTSGGGTWSFNMVGNNALGDLAQESKNWPKQGQMSETGKPGWGNSLPKNEGEMAEASKIDWGSSSPHAKRSDEMLADKHMAPPQHADLQSEPLRILPPSDGEKVVEKRAVDPNDPNALIPFPNDPSKGHLWHSGTPFDMPKSEDTSSATDGNVVEKRAVYDQPKRAKASNEWLQKIKPEDRERVASWMVLELPDFDDNVKSVEKRASDPKDIDDEVAECCKHKHKHSSSSTNSQPPYADDDHVVKRGLPVGDLPGHPYFVGHAAANAVVQPADSQPTMATIHDLHAKAVAYDDQQPSPTQQLEPRSERTQLHPSPSPSAHAHEYIHEFDIADLPKKPITDPRVAVTTHTSNPIIVMPGIPSPNHKDHHSHKLNTIEICVVVLMALGLFCGLVCLAVFGPRKCMRRRAVKMAAVAEMRQREMERDVELAELNDGGLEREVVVVGGGAGRGEMK